MTDTECVGFLQWALPRLRMRWPGYRKVRRQVCRRVGRRLRELDLSDVAAYRRYLESRPEEWRVLDDACRITISRFHRDRGVFEALENEVLPVLARAAGARECRRLRGLSVGCASGEEAYSLKLLWELRLAHRFSALDLTITAVDSHPVMLERARRACYRDGSLKELPPEWTRIAFQASAGHELCLREPFRRGIRFVQCDVREALPRGPFHLVLCRNLVFTYFDEALQCSVLDRLHEETRDGAALVVGAHESVPSRHAGFRPWGTTPAVYRRVAAGAR